MDLNIGIWPAGEAVMPVNDPVVLGIDGGLCNRFRPLLPERAPEFACTATGATVLRETLASPSEPATQKVG